MVKLYTKDKCPNCKQTKRMLKASSIDFIEVNVMKDDKAFDKVKNELGFTNLPIVEADGYETFEYNKTMVANFIKGYNK